MTLKCEKQGHVCMHPACHTSWTARHWYLQFWHLKSLSGLWIWKLLLIRDICPTYVLKRGIPEDSPPKPMMSWHPCGISLHSLILISQSTTHLLTSQSAFSPVRPCPRRLHKLWDMSCSFHSDSDQQKDNVNRTQPPALSTFIIDSSLHQCVALARLSHSLQLHASSTTLDY